uniref:Uncharacterized protein n=1 Tax=Bos mutus grunniens TaxID=30521 RepID=A0A8B9W9J5_BOSMU
MSYCWRLQYYCKLGAAHGARPIYYVFQLPRQAHPFRNQQRIRTLPRGSVPGGPWGHDLTSGLVVQPQRLHLCSDLG